MSYQLTMEDYISLINYYSLHNIFTINCGEIRITNRANINPNKHRLVFDGPEINCTCNINEKIITKNTYPHAHGSYIEFVNVEMLTPPTELALRIFEFNKLKERDIESLNLLCISFIKDFKGVDLSLDWNGDLNINSVKDKNYYYSDWNYYISKSLSFFGIDSEIFVEYFSDGKEKLCNYSKFKDIEAFL